MKYILPLILFLCSSIVLTAQVQKLSMHRIVIGQQINLTKDNLRLATYDVFPKVENKILSANTRLINNELIINYELTPSGKEGYYIVRVDIKMDGQAVELHPGYLLGDIGLTKTDKGRNKKIIWTNVLAQLPKAQGQLEVTVSAELWGIQFLAYNVNCDEYPQFGLKQKLPYYAGLGLGAGSILAGVVLRNKANQHFDRHREAITLSERNQQYQNYSDKLKTAEIVTYVGAGIIAADIVLYLLRKERHKKRVRIFEEFCGEERITLQPTWAPPTVDSPQNIGFRFSYQF